MWLLRGLFDPCSADEVLLLEKMDNQNAKFASEVRLFRAVYSHLERWIYKSYPQRGRYDCVKCDIVLARVFPPLRSLCSDPLRARDLSSPKSSVYQISSMAIMPGFGRE